MPDLNDMFANAPLSEGGWERALEKLGDRTGSQRAQIIGFGGPSAVPFNHVSNVGSPHLLDDFVAINGGDPRVNWRVAATSTPFRIIWEDHYAEIRRQKRFAIYDDFAATHEMMHGCQTVLSAAPSGFIGMALLRSDRDGRTSAEDRQLFSDVAPTVLNAIRMQQALHHQGAHLLAGTMEAMGSTTFLLDSSWHVIAMTPSAEREASGHGAIVLRQSAIRAVDRDGDRRLQQALGRLFANERPPVERLWLPHADPADRGSLCEIYPLPGREWSFGAAPRLMLALRRLDQPGSGNVRLLEEAFGLSRAEASVAAMLSAGLSRAEIAQRRGVRPDTVRDQIKTIFRKAHVHRESQLVALIARLLG